MASSTFLRWAGQSLGPPLGLRRAARNGQLGARLAIDRSLWDDPYPTYEQMRERGPLLTGGLVYSTTSHAVTSDVLRSPAFRVGVGSSERLSPFARRMLSRTVD